MALATALATDTLIDDAIVYLGESWPPVDAFSVRPIGTEGVVENRISGTSSYQVEVTGTLPTAADDVTNWETGSGANAAVAVNTNVITVRNEITAVEQTQGLSFATALPSLAEALGRAVWLKCTAQITTGNFGAATSMGATGTLTAAELGSLRVAVDAKTGVACLLQLSEAGPIMPTDKNSFEFSQSGGYGFDRFHFVSNFTGATALCKGFACRQQAMVVVGGLPKWAAQETGTSYHFREQLPILGFDGLGAEFKGWTNTATGSQWMAMSIVFGAKAADANSGQLLTSTT